MTKNTNFVSHKKSKQKVGNKPQLPLAESLVEGEIAINFAKDVETLSIKNESGDVVTFSSDNYYSEQKLGSAFTGANSAVTVTDVLENLDLGDEVEVNSGNTPTGETIEIWVDESEDPEEADVYTKAEVNTLLEGKLDEDVFESYSGTVIEQIGERALQGDLDVLSGITTAHTANTDIHVTASDKTAWDAKLDSSDVDQVIDSTTSASTDPVSTSAVYDFVEQVKQDFDGALDDLSDKIDEHSGDTVMHITSAERTAWNAKVDASDLNGYADAVTYNSTTHYVEFYHGTTAGTKVFEYDAAPFIIDGMVDNVEIADVSGTTCLVISFNTDAGKQDINVPVSDIFDADEYYTKDEIDEADEIVAAALNDLEERKMDVSGMTNYYTKSETSGASEISSAIVDMTILNTDLRHDFSTHSADTTMHFSEGEKAIFTDLTKNAEYYSGITSADTTNWDNKQDQLVSGTNIKTINNESLLGSGNIEITISDELWESGTGLNAVVLKNSSGTASSDFAIADGVVTTASGPVAHAEGGRTSATTAFAHSEGLETIANGMYSHAEGWGTIASGQASHTEGTGTTASGNYSHAEGAVTTASGSVSHAEGISTEAIGEGSHAEGNDTKASGECSHAEGSNTVSNGLFSHAEGEMTITSNRAEHANGFYNISLSEVPGATGHSGNTLFSVGNGDYETRHNAFEIRQNGDIYIVSGNTDIKLQDNLGGNITVDQVLDDTTSASTNPVSSKAVYKAVTDNELVWTNAFVALSGTVSAHTSNTEIHVTAADKTAWNAKLDASAYTPTEELWVSGTGLNSVVLKGSSGTASGDYSVAEGVNTIANEYAAHAEGDSTSATSDASHAEGDSTFTEGYASHAEGYSTSATSEAAHAEGYITLASGEDAHAEGSGTIAEGDCSHAEGYSTSATSMDSHAEGIATLASGDYSHAEGNSTSATNYSSHAEGSYTIANNISEHASGRYNVSNSGSTEFGHSGNTLFSVGNGTADDTRHNAFEIRQNGDIYCSDGTNNVKLQDTITATTANTTALGGLSLVKLTQAEYDALVTKDSNTLYVIVN